MSNPNDIPRRNRTEAWTPAEDAIFNAMQCVEMAGAHPLLTDAISLLQQARDKVADFVEQPVDGRTEEEKIAQSSSRAVATDDLS